MTPTTNHHDDSYEHNPEVAHEHSDVNVRTVLMAALVLAVVTGVAMLAMAGVFKLLEHQAATNDPQVSPLAVPAGQLPPEPRLQTNEYAGLEEFREKETQSLQGYGWVDQKTGVARVPIAEAKKLLLQRGLPARAGQPIDPALGTKAPSFGEANGGRWIAKPTPPPGAPTAPPQQGPAQPHQPAPAPPHKGGH